MLSRTFSIEPYLSRPVSFVRLRKLQERVPKSRSSIYRDVAAGLLPAPIKLGRLTSVWADHEIDCINAAAIAGANNDEIRQLVSLLVAARSSFRNRSGAMPEPQAA